MPRKKTGTIRRDLEAERLKKTAYWEPASDIWQDMRTGDPLNSTRQIRRIAAHLERLCDTDRQQLQQELRQLRKTHSETNGRLKNTHDALQILKGAVYKLLHARKSDRVAWEERLGDLIAGASPTSTFNAWLREYTKKKKEWAETPNK